MSICQTLNRLFVPGCRLPPVWVGQRPLLGPRGRPSTAIAITFASSSTNNSASLYDILGVKSNCEQQTIKEAFFRLSKEVHPDLNPNKADANESFRNLAAAYQVLSSPESRAQYDHELGIRKRKRVSPPHTQNQWSPYKTASPPPSPARNGVDPEFGRRVEVDLSPERMAKAWEAYKRRWAIEEERLRILEERKLRFRMELDEARKIQYSNMTLEEREALKENMRNLRTPQSLKDEEKNGGEKSTQQQQQKQTRPPPPQPPPPPERPANNKDKVGPNDFTTAEASKSDSVRKRTRRIDLGDDPRSSQATGAEEQYEDPSQFGSDPSMTKGEFMSQWGKNMQQQSASMKDGWQRDRPSDNSHKYGLDLAAENRFSWLWTMIILGTLVIAVTINNTYMNDPIETNAYLAQLKKEQDELALSEKKRKASNPPEGDKE